MTAGGTELVALPLGTLALAWYALRPLHCVVAPRRLAAARAAVAVGCYAVVSVEVLSAVGRLSLAGVVIAWLLGLAVAAAGAAVRRRRAGVPLDRVGWKGPVTWWRSQLRTSERLVAAVLVVLVAAELVLALASPPNTYDSQTYHLPRIERWVQQGSVDLFPTAIRRQITYPPGAEFILLHLRLLTGGDALHNLSQWSAGVLCLLLVTRLGAQLGLGRRAQLLGALVVGSVPMVVLQASSTQTDLTVAAWVACVATLVLDGVGAGRARPALSTVLLIGGATGLVTVTKPTGALLVGPLLVWWALAQLRRDPPDGRRAGPLHRVGRLALAALLITGAAAVLAGPQMVRVYQVFGHALGPPDSRDTLLLGRRDPASLVVNGLRQTHTLFEVPAPPVNRWTAERVIDLAGALGRDANDPRTTFFQQRFPDEAWYPHEDKAALPLHAALFLIGAVAALRHPDRRRAVLVAVLAIGVVGFAVALRWQPWGNRLVLFLVVPAGPLAGAWLDKVLDDGRRLAKGAVTVAVVVAALAGVLSAAYGYPRRLVGADSALTRDDWAARFAIRPQWEPSYRRAAEAVNARGARRIGTAAQFDNWEYPWWLLLRGRELLSLQSPAPGKLPPARLDQVDAVVCAGPQWHCQRFVPAGWEFQHDGVVGWALPPTRP